MGRLGGKRASAIALVAIPAVGRVRSIALACCGALIASLVTVVGVDLASSPPATAADSPTYTRPDSVSAMVAARQLDHPVEDLSQGTAALRVLANPDGSWTNEEYSGPIRVQDDQGAWHDIDTTLVERDGALVPRYAATDLSLSDGGDSTFASMTADGRDLDFKWPSTLPKPVVDGSTATYRDVIPGGDLVVTATADGLTHDVVLRDRPTAPLDLTVKIATDGADLTETHDGGLVIADSHGDTVASAAAPTMWDSSSNGSNEDSPVPVDTSVGSTRAGTPTLTLSPDDNFLSDPSTVYPVTVDPTFTTWATSDTWVESGSPSTNHGGSDYLSAGSSDGTNKTRSYVAFTSATSKLVGKDITDAKLYLDNFSALSCSSGQVNVSRVQGFWGPTSLTWSTQPTVDTSTQASLSAAYGGGASCPTDWAVFDIDAIAQAWADGTTNYGLRVWANNETSTNAYRQYRSADYAYSSGHPHINVTYRNYPVAGALSTSPGNAGYVTSTTPTLTSTLTDADGGTVRGNFQVLNSSGTAIWSGSSAYVASGKSASVQVPTGVLTPGSNYTFTVKAYDGALQTKTAKTKAVVVDTTAPSESLSATSPGNTDWVSSAPAASFLTISGDSDVSSFKVDNLITGKTMTLAADSSGAATSAPILSAWPATQGWNSWRITPVDKAGNVGASPQTFSFGVGNTSIGQPLRATTSLGKFPVSASGRAGASSASLQWRYNQGSSSAWQNLTNVTKNGSAWGGTAPNNSSGTAALTGDLVWDAGQQIDITTSAPIKRPSTLEIRACFTYPTGADCSPGRVVELVASGLDGNLPTTDVGPLQVALTTGDSALSEVDAVDSMAGVGRSYTSFGPQTKAAGGAFGPGWNSTVVAQSEVDSDLLDHRGTDKNFVLVSSANSSETFTKVDPNATTGSIDYKPEAVDDGSRLTVNGSTATLKRPFDGPVTTWTCSASPCVDNSAWTVTSGATTGVTATDPAVEVTSASDGYPSWIAQTQPGVSTSCTAAVQTKGCRGLKLTYTGTGTQKRLTQVESVVGTDTTPVTTTLATYAYSDMASDGGKLTQACGAGTTPLCVSYTYTTISGRVQIATMTPPGQATWTFGYDTTGRLTTVTRPLDATTNTTTGTATWTVAYDLSPSSSGLPDMSATAIADWGQTAVPTSVASVFPPSHVPSTTPTSADLPYAQLWYSDVTGSTTNTAQYGAGQWLVDTDWVDNGNVVRSLGAAGRAKALAAPSTSRAQVASDASEWTVYDDSSRVLAEYGPTHQSTLDDGTVGNFRSATRYTYSTTAGEEDLVTETRHSASLPDMTKEYDVTVVDNEYDAIVTGDGDGHDFGIPTKVKTQVSSNVWSTEITRFDQDGRVIETRQPGGGENSTTHKGNDAHSTVTTYYSPGGGSDPDCDSTNHKEWTGLTCKVGPAAQPSGQPIPITWNKEYGPDLQPTIVRQYTGPNDYKETTTSYDTLGRQSGTTIITKEAGTTTSTLTNTQTYNSTSGLPANTSNSSGTIARTFDSWGRPKTYNDLGTTSSYKYTVDGMVASRNDGVGTTTYTYDGTTATGSEHRGLLTGVDAGLTTDPDAFALSYDNAGQLSSASYPNGTTATFGYDDAGTRTSLTYAANGSTYLAFGATADPDGRTVGTTSPLSNRKLTFDNLGRLTTVQDNQADGCSTRSYGFSPSSERTSLTSWDPDSNTGACTTSGTNTAKTWSYDSANRITNSGYTYDKLGRTLTLPASDTAPGGTGTATVSYYANDQPASMIQARDGTTRHTNYDLDPSGRPRDQVDVAAGGGSQTNSYYYSDDSDSPTSTYLSGATSSQRYVNIPGLGLAMTATAGGTNQTDINLANMQGDVVGRASDDASSVLLEYNETNEYGQPLADKSGYQWKGAAQRPTDYSAGLILMGARLYNPATGSFLQADPVLGGNLTAYAYPLDPTNQEDLTGRSACTVYSQYSCGWRTYPDSHHKRVYIHFSKKLMKSIAYGAAGTAALGTAIAILIPGGALAGALIDLVMGIIGGGIAYMLDHGYTLAIRIKFYKSWVTFGKWVPYAIWPYFTQSY